METFNRSSRFSYNTLRCRRSCAVVLVGVYYMALGLCAAYIFVDRIRENGKLGFVVWLCRHMYSFICMKILCTDILNVFHQPEVK